MRYIRRQDLDRFWPRAWAGWEDDDGITFLLDADLDPNEQPILLVECCECLGTGSADSFDKRGRPIAGVPCPKCQGRRYFVRTAELASRN